MPIAAAGHVPPLLSSFVERVQTLSETDLKVYSLVVLGSILTTLGIVLACISPYIAFTVHPMVATAGPPIPIIAGALVTHVARQTPVKEAPIRPIGSPPVLGREREGCNCWTIAGLVALFNLPVFARLQEDNTSPLGKAYQQYVDDKRLGRKVSRVDAQEIRVWLSQLTGVPSLYRVSPQSSVQHSPRNLIEAFLRLHGSAPNLLEYHVTAEGAKTDLFVANRTPITCFDLEHEVYAPLPSVKEGFDRFFNRLETTPSRTTEISHRFERPPTDFFVGIGQSDPEGKFECEVEVNETLTFSETIMGEKASYQCDAFFGHQSDSRESGHWVVGVFVNGHWWLVNDRSARYLTPEEARQMRNTSPYIHYSRAHP